MEKSDLHPSRAKLFIFTTLARYQTEFWVKVADQLQAKGYGTAFIAFDDESREILENTDHLTYALGKQEIDVEYRLNSEPLDYIESFGVENIHFWLGHEKSAFGLFDEKVQLNKLAACLRLADEALSQLNSEFESVEMIQELGGFLSVIGSYFAARKHKVNNWFVEPAFFRGRLFFLKNTFNAIKISVDSTLRPSEETDNYINDTLSSGAIVIPIKDKHQYSKAFEKIMNTKNIKRFGEKLAKKYFLGRHFEFGHIRHHLFTHMKMLVNSARLKKLYTDLNELGDFLYYPLHVPGDMALTLRSPEYFDQLALIEYIARNLKSGQILAIKEHPALIGSMNCSRLLQLLKENQSIKLLNPEINNFEVLKSCSAVVSVNSKSGAEGALLGKAVFVLGDSFYKDAPIVSRVNSLKDLSTQIRCFDPCCTKNLQENDVIKNYFENVWRQSYPGELYFLEQNNYDIFVASLLAVVSCQCN